MAQETNGEKISTFAKNIILVLLAALLGAITTGIYFVSNQLWETAQWRSSVREKLSRLSLYEEQIKRQGDLADALNIEIARMKEIDSNTIARVNIHEEILMQSISGFDLSRKQK